MLTLREYLGSPSVFGEVPIAHLFSFLCHAVFFVFVFVLCLVYPMLPAIALACPLFAAHLVFSNVYLLTTILLLHV